MKIIIKDKKILKSPEFNKYFKTNIPMTKENIENGIECEIIEGRRDKIKDGGPAFPVLKKEKNKNCATCKHLYLRGDKSCGDKGIVCDFAYSGWEPIEDNKDEEGMSLRDYFAAKASDEDIREIMYRNENITSNHEGSIIHLITRQQARYIHSDSMLEAREK